MLLLLATFMCSACVTTEAELECKGPKTRPANLHYGDSELRVTPPVKTVHRGGNFSLRLRPNTAASHGGVDVTVVGKTANDQTLIDSRTESYKSATDRRIVWCVDENQPLGEYSYKVTVPGVGTLDPRVDVN